MGRSRKITYELKLGNIVHLLYGLTNGKLADNVTMDAIFTQPLPGENPPEFHTCNHEFLDCHFADIFYDLNIKHPRTQIQENQIYSDFYGRPQNKKQYNSSGGMYIEVFIAYMAESEKDDSGNPSALSRIYSANKKVLEQWNVTSFCYRIKEFISHIPDAEKTEINKPMDYNDLVELLDLVKNFLDTNTIDGYAKALSWLLIGSFLRTNIKELFRKIGKPSIYANDNSISLLSDNNAGNNTHSKRLITTENTIYTLQNELRSTVEKAETGDIQAAYEAGCMYLHRFDAGGDSDMTEGYSKAFEYLKKVADSSHPLSNRASFLLGRLYYWGEVPGEQQSFEKALFYRTQTSPKVSRYLIEGLFYMKLHGMGGGFDYDEINTFIEQNYTIFTDRAYIHAADFYIKYGKFSKAIDLLNNLEKSNPDAEFMLGKLYLNGVHCSPPKPDPTMAEYHFLKSSEAGNQDAFYELGIIYFHGSFGHRQNIRKARDFFRKAAIKGHIDAQYIYGWLCRRGQGGERDFAEAIKYLELSARSGHTLSMMELAVLYQERGYVNYEKAFEWVMKAVELGEPNSEFMLGNMYYSGRGCKQSFDKASIHYKNALETGFFEAEIMLERINKMKNMYDVKV